MIALSNFKIGYLQKIHVYCISFYLLNLTSAYSMHAFILLNLNKRPLKLPFRSQLINL